MKYDENYELREIPCVICKCKASTAYVAKDLPDGNLPDMICNRNNGACVKKYINKLMQINIKKIEAPKLTK